MPPTLLLADDSMTIQRVVALMFADEDITVVTVSDGDQAINELNRTPPDIVLADTGMPGRSGYDVARHIRQTPALAHIPVLLLTGAFEPVDQAMAVEVGCDGVLAKPFEPQLVIRRVKELLARSKNWSEAARTDAPSTRPSDELDRYFEQLDDAFTKLAATPGASDEQPAPSERERRAVPDADQPGAAREEAAADAPLFEAFSALLAAEQSRTANRASLALTATAAAPSIDVDALTEAVIRRVIERLPDRLTRDVVAPIVSEMAERLIRDEIERIKRNIK